MQPNEDGGQTGDDGVERHFPNTAKLLQERAKSESPARQRLDEGAMEDGAAETGVVTDLTAVEGGDDEAASARLQARLDRASARRDQMLEARRQSLGEAAAQRKQKIKHVAELRRAAVEAFMVKAPSILDALRAAGLTDREEQSPEVIEHILVSDPRVCPTCTPTEAAPTIPASCPVTHKPHRRSLVVAAEALLKLIGNTKVNLSPSKLADTSGVDAQPAKPMTRRGITVQPHLFVLAYYYAAMKDAQGEEVDALLRHSAQHLTSIVEQLRMLCHPDDDEAASSTTSKPSLPAKDKLPYLTNLLASFAKTWRQYAKLAERHTKPSSPAGKDGTDLQATRRAVVEELVQSTTDALVAAQVTLALRNFRSAEEELALMGFLQVLARRLHEIGGPGALEAAMEKASIAAANATANASDELERGRSTEAVSEATTTTAAQRQAPDTSPPLTPEAKPKRSTVVVPPAPLAHYATSTDTEGERGGRQPVSFGPALPPHWFVDADGVSRPPPQEVVDSLLGDKRRQLELRARTAFQAKLKIVDPLSEQEEATQKVTKELREVALEVLRNDLNASPPVLDRLPSVLNSIADALLEALPKRLRSKIGKEIQDVLDWSAVRQNVRRSEGSIAELMKYVVTRVIELGAPARDSELREKSAAFERRLEARAEPLGDIIAPMFQFMLEAIRQLRLDISAFTMTMISQELVSHAEEYHTELLKECFPHPSRWQKTIAFFQEQLSSNVQGIRELLANPQFERSGASVATTEKQRVMRAALFLGVVDLLRSARRTGELRWDAFPSEALVIEKQQVFDAANAVQQDTLSIMLSGTVSMLLQTKRLRERSLLHTFLTTIDAKLRGEWLPTATNISELQSMIASEVNNFLSDEQMCEVPCILTDAELSMLNGMVVKMTDTLSTQYSTFEGRVVFAVQQTLLLDSRDAQAIPVNQRPKTIGLASASAFQCGAKLRCVLDYHWSVLRPFYDDMSDALEFPTLALQ